MKLLYLLLIAVFIITLNSCTNNGINCSSKNNKYDTIKSNINGQGINFVFYFKKGKSYNHPSFVFWLEDLEGNYIQTLFITDFVGKGIYNYADGGNWTWMNKKGESIRPATLPYWSYRRNIVARDSIFIPTPETAVADAYTGATPKNNFILNSKTDYKLEKSKFKLMLEINQTWDWNEYWKNDLYPNDKDYMSSCQPSLIYSVTIDLNSNEKEYYFNPIGHGHYAGKDGKLYTNLSSHTTALKIIDQLKVVVE